MSPFRMALCTCAMLPLAIGLDSNHSNTFDAIVIAVNHRRRRRRRQSEHTSKSKVRHQPDDSPDPARHARMYDHLSAAIFPLVGSGGRQSGYSPSIDSQHTVSARTTNSLHRTPEESNVTSTLDGQIARSSRQSKADPVLGTATVDPKAPGHAVNHRCPACSLATQTAGLCSPIDADSTRGHTDASSGVSKPPRLPPKSVDRQTLAPPVSAKRGVADR